MLIGSPIHETRPIFMCSAQQGIPQHIGIGCFHFEPSTKDARLVPAVRMRWREAIIPEFGEIDHDLAKLRALSIIAHAATTRSEWKHAA